MNLDSLRPTLTADSVKKIAQTQGFNVKESENQITLWYAVNRAGYKPGTIAYKHYAKIAPDSFVALSAHFILTSRSLE